MLGRTSVVVVLAVVVLGLFQLDDPHARPARAPSPIAGAAVDPQAVGTTWYCPAGVEPGEAPPAHQVVITNPGRAVTATVTGFRSAEAGSAGVAAAVPSVSTTEVAAHSQLTIAVAGVGAGVGGVTVELTGDDAGTATVAHRLVASNRSDQSDCLTRASDRWYFAAANTEIGASAKLWLLNPFPSDASVDIRISADTFVRIPKSVRGLIIPAGTSRVVDLGRAAQRRGQFAFTVETRGGRVAAELAQSVNGRGLRLQVGSNRAVKDWLLADSFGGPNVTEQLHVFNPTGSPVTASVSVIPDGYDRLAFPVPFELEIDARHFATVNISSEPRVPPDSLRWIRVQTLDGAGVVVTQVVELTDAGGDGTAETRPPVAGGLASSIGASAQASQWYVTSLDPGPDSQSVVVIANPSEKEIAIVTMTDVTTGPARGVGGKLEIPPLTSLAVDVSDAAGGKSLGLLVKATSPVVVSGRTTSNARADLAMWTAVPVASTATALPPPPGD